MNCYMDMSTAEIILNYAESRSRFTLNELSEYVRNRETISDSGILWHIKRLIKDKKLSRIARGQYGYSVKKEYSPTLSDTQKKLYVDIHSQFPLINICVYGGAEISAMQHHVSPNNAIYVEVDKDATEAVFHWLADQGIKAYHRPSENLMTEYVNLSEECFIVKPLVTESPLVTVDGVRMPALEKLLVDINKDPDFYYLQGGESFYIMDFAKTMYQLNEPRMLRYASRRGIRKELTEILNYK